MRFLVRQTDLGGLARLGRLSTAHGEIDTPAFMPVGSLGPVKGVDGEDLQALGADIIMAFDECLGLPASRDRVQEAMLRTNRWAARCLAARRRTDQALFGIVQGGHDADLRVHAARAIVAMGFDGYAVGGLS